MRTQPNVFRESESQESWASVKTFVVCITCLSCAPVPHPVTPSPSRALFLRHGLLREIARAGARKKLKIEFNTSKSVYPSNATGAGDCDVTQQALFRVQSENEQDG